MVTRLHDTRLERFAQWTARLAPDAATMAVILTFFTAGIALSVGNTFQQVSEAYHQGLWMLLPFSMQMTLIVVLSSALAITPFCRGAIARLARLPGTRNQFIITAFLGTGAAGYANWGLGYALGPMIAIYCAAEAERKGVAVDFPFLLATSYAGQSLWQYGVSSSGPLLVATNGHFLQNVIGVIPLSRTIWSPAALLHEAVFAAAGIFAACRLMPKTCRPLSQFPESQRLAKPPAAPAAEDTRQLSFAQRQESNSLIVLMLCSMIGMWIAFHFFVKRLSLDINSLNAIFMFLTFLLHRTVKRFVHAVQQCIVASWPVIILYHLYAGIAGLIQYTSVGEKATRMAASISTAATYPAITALAGVLFGCFIPSSGGQWTIQGFVTVKTAMAVGVSVPRGMLALGVGDHTANFLTPFWYVLVAGIARVDFRSFFGYGLVFAAIWFAIGLVVFSFAPC